MKKSLIIRKVSLVLLLLSLLGTILAILCAKLGFTTFDFEELHEHLAFFFIVMVLYHLTLFRKSLKALLFSKK